MFNTWDRNANNMQAGDWFGYTFQVSGAGTHHVAATFQSFTSGQLSILVDGNPVGTAAIFNTGGAPADTAVYDVSLGAGVHSVSVRDQGGAFGVTAVKIGL